jgi:PAS domain S-box-containing protein
MKNDKKGQGELQRRILQEYIFNLEEMQEKAEEISIANEKLKQSEDFLMAVLGSTPHGICLIKNNVFVWSNQALARILGWEQDELIGQSICVICQGEKACRRMPGGVCIAHPSGLIAEEYDFTHKDGHYVPCMVTGSPSSKADPSKGHVLSFVDFTRLKRAREELGEAYKRLEARTNEVTHTNERLTKEIQERIEAEERLEQYRNHLEDLIKERTKELNSANRHLVKEIQERREKEGTLREMEELESSILAAISHAVIGVKEQRIVFANNAVETVFGWKPEELAGRSTRILYGSEEVYDEIGKLLYPALQERRTCNMAFPCRRKDGGYMLCKISASRIGDSLQEKYAVITYEDITEMKRAEEEREKLQAQLLQAQKMEAIGTLAGGIAHDFNNVLMGIQGYASLMLLRKDSSDPDYEKLKGIEAMVGSAADLTAQLLGFARGGKYRVTVADLNALLTRTAEMFGRARREIVIHRMLDGNLSFVSVDERQIEQAILNLYVNAWQAMPEGGTIHIRSENAFIDESEARRLGLRCCPYVKVSITDSGIGMDEATRRRVFEPFFTTKKMGRGAGLGLASTYGIIRNHQGLIEVQSEKGRGSTFTIYLPASDKVPALEKKGFHAIRRGSESILLVDDQREIIEAGGAMLRALGYSVLTATGGRDAIDLVILDMIMPELSGKTTYEALKEIDPHVKVLLCSGYSVNSETSEILQRGCNGFIQKPYDLGTLSFYIREVLEDSRST